MAGKPGVLLKLFIGFCVMVGVLLIIATWMFFRRPLTLDAWFSRVALSLVGFEKHGIQTARGEITYFEGGDGPTLVLLHGAGDQAGAWARIVQPLQTTHRLVIPDLAGHGDSDPAEGPLGIDVVLASAEAVLDDCCGEEPVTLVGNSMGAWVAMLYARDHPDRVSRIIALNGGAIEEKEPQVNLFPTNREEARRTMEGLMGTSAGLIPDHVLDDVVRHARTGPAARLAATAESMRPYLLDDRLHEVTTPVNLVWGDADGLLTLAYAQRLLDGLPAAQMTVLVDCGHVPHRECPNDVVETFQKILASDPPSPVAPAEPDPSSTGDAEGRP